MDLTIKDMHEYYDLVTEGKAPKLEISGCEGGDRESLLIPRIDGEEKLFLYDMQTGTKVYPGINLTEHIRSYLTSSS